MVPPPDWGLPRSPTKSANSPARSCPIESAKIPAVFQREPIRERQTTALNRSPKRCHPVIQEGATPRFRPVDDLADESIGVNRYVCHRLFGSWFDSRVAPCCSLPKMVPPPGLWPSQVGDQERQLTCEELLDRICEKHGSFQRAPIRERQTTALNRSPKRCHPLVLDGATPRLRPIDGLAVESIGGN
jgi:hypothetical protein